MPNLYLTSSRYIDTDHPLDRIKQELSSVLERRLTEGELQFLDLLKNHEESITKCTVSPFELYISIMVGDDSSMGVVLRGLDSGRLSAQIHFNHRVHTWNSGTTLWPRTFDELLTGKPRSGSAELGGG